MLDFDLFRRVVDEAGPSLGRIDFFNYGEAFLHKRARRDVRVHQDARSRTSTSTRAPTAWRFTEEQARRLVHSGIDEVTFSIDGATPESYARYRQRGKFDIAIREPARDGRREARGRPRRAVPQLALHPVQLERQRRGDGRSRARWRPRSASIGCAGRSPIIPEDAFSRRFVPGTPEFDASGTRSGTTATSATPFPAPRRARGSTSERLAAGPAAHRSARPARRQRPHARAEPLHAPVPRAGDLRPPPRAPRRAAVRRGRHADRSRLRARLAAVRRSQPGADVDVPIEIPAPSSRAATR